MLRVLIVRLDAIGDAILFSGALPDLREAFGDDTELCIACRRESAAVYKSCPELNGVVPIDVRSLGEGPSSAAEVAAPLAAWEPDILIHPTRSRERLSESLVAAVPAGKKIAIEMDFANATAEEGGVFDAGYDSIIPSPSAAATELDRHADLLRGLGVCGGPVRPRVVLTDEDCETAARVYADAGAEGHSTVVLTPAARWSVRLYPHWPEAVSSALRRRRDVRHVLVLGGSDAVHHADAIADDLEGLLEGLSVVRLCGQLELRTSLAVIARARCCVGNETFSMHAACGLGVPNAVLLGGGHFGRFMPYDGLTCAAALPLDCFGCDWHCRHDRPHCIQDVPPYVVSAAISAALDGRADRARVFIPADGTSGGSLERTAAVRTRVPHAVAERTTVYEVADSGRGVCLTVSAAGELS